MVSYNKLVILLYTCAVFYEAKSDDSSVKAEESTLVNQLQEYCQNVTLSATTFDYCKGIKDRLNALEKIFQSLPKDQEESEQLSNFKNELKSLTLHRINKLKNLFNRLDMDLGFSGLMENFRVFGIPMSKLWALSILLDPFEI